MSTTTVVRDARPLAAAVRFGLSIVLACIVLVAPAPPARAAEGFRLTADIVFRLDTDVPVVRVESTYRMTNTTPDRDLGDGRVRSFFFDDVVLPLTPGAADVTVEVDGRATGFEVRDDEGYPYVDVSLGYELRHQRTATIVVDYLLPGDPPRTPDTFTRVNPAYVSFPVAVFADDGLGSVRIEIPEAWVPEYVGADLVGRLDGGLRILEANGIAHPPGFWVAFTARDDSRLTSETVTVGETSFEVRSWPGDAGWAEFATRLVSEGPPALEAIVGEPWPTTRTTVVIEASTPYLRGYAGYYFASDNSIEVGEELDGQTMLHELSHVWFNSARLRQRWLSEGLAEAVSVAAARELGERVDELDGAVDDESEPFPLNEWRPPTGDDDTTEAFGYATSYLVIGSLIDEIGEDARTRLLSAVIRGVRAYPGEGGEVATGGAVDWRSFLDLAEQVGGAVAVEELYRDHVVTAAQLGILDRRADAVGAFEQLAVRGGAWAPPERVRSAMAAWRFDTALGAIEDAHDALDVRDALAAALAPLGLVPTPAIEEAYQDASITLDDVRADLRAQHRAADELAAGRGELMFVLRALDLDVPELTQRDYEQDPIGVVDANAELVDDANALATTQSELDGVLDRLGVSVPPLGRRAFVDDRGAAQQRLDELLAAARVVAAAHERREAADSFLERIGAIGSDADASLAAADDHLSDGDPDRAIDAATAAVAAIDDLDDAGRTRMLAAGVVAMFLIAGSVAVRARRHRRFAAPDEHAPAGDDADDRVDAGARPADDGGGPPPTVG